MEATNVVLVHGAWADGSSWGKVIPLLQDKGFNVTAGNGSPNVKTLVYIAAFGLDEGCHYAQRAFQSRGDGFTPERTHRSHRLGRRVNRKTS